MSLNIRERYGLPDPVHYDRLIEGKKTFLKQSSKDSDAWVELGCLHEAKLDLTQYLAKKVFIFRYFPLFFLLFISAAIYAITHIIINLPAGIMWQKLVFPGLLAAIIFLIFPYMIKLRYPKSGKKYFMKAIELNPECGEAYMHLGLIALRRFRKRKGCRMLEQAIRLGLDSNKINRELKSIYESEFVRFFEKKNIRERNLQTALEKQNVEIIDLRLEIANLKNRNESLSGKTKKTKRDIDRARNLHRKDLMKRIIEIRNDYEKQINELKKQTGPLTEQAEEAFVARTSAIIKTDTDQDFCLIHEAENRLQEMLGADIWNKLPQQSQKCLINAEQIYRVFSQHLEWPDFSPVGMELCRALELEINRTLVKPFLQQLNGCRQDFLKINQTGELHGLPVYFSCLAKAADDNNFPGIKSLTLGQYLFALKNTLQGEYVLKAYSEFLDGLCSSSDVIIGNTFLKKLEIVTKKFRNSLAHGSIINREQCDHLRWLAVNGNEALLAICCQIQTN